MTAPPLPTPSADDPPGRLTVTWADDPLTFAVADRDVTIRPPGEINKPGLPGPAAGLIAASSWWDDRDQDRDFTHSSWSSPLAQRRYGLLAVRFRDDEAFARFTARTRLSFQTQRHPTFFAWEPADRSLAVSGSVHACHTDPSGVAVLPIGPWQIIRYATGSRPLR